MIVNDAAVYDNVIIGPKWEQWYLLISDLHYDSPDCDRQLLRKHLVQARERNARIFIFGDIFDAMGAKHDPRTNKSMILPEHQKENYFDYLVEDAAKFFAPYKENIKFIAFGNHEFSVTKRHETDLTYRLTKELDSGIDYGRHTGFIRLKFARATSAGRESGRESKVIYYAHGSGGTAPVTKGVTKTNRRSVSIDADFFISGHIHQGWNVPHGRKRLTASNKVLSYEQEHIQLGTYKDSGEWEESKEFGTPIKGGYWVRFYQYGHKHKLVYDLIRAK